MIYVGIDTGVNTGIAVWREGEFRLIETVGIVKAMALVIAYVDQVEDDITVVIEDARLRTWIPREKSNAEYRGKLMGAGSVKRDASIWEEFCQLYDVNLLRVPPKNNTTKLSADAFARITGWKGRTSEHARDAAMLVFGRK